MIKFASISFLQLVLLSHSNISLSNELSLPPTPCLPVVICEAESHTHQEIQTYNTLYNTIHNTHITTEGFEPDVICSSSLPLEVSASHITNDERDRGGECGDSTEQLPPLGTLAAQILKCQTWGSALELIDDTSTATGKNRGTVLKKLIRCFSQRDCLRFLALLDLHASHNPSDERAAKALTIASSNSQQGEKLEK